MGLFRKKRDDQSTDPNARSPQLGVMYKDLAVLGQLMKHGADLTESRHVIYFSYAPNEIAAQSMRREAEALGFSAEVRDPLPEYPDRWAVVAEIHAVTSAEFVRDSDDLFQGIADRHGADYDGWEASI